MGLSFVSLVLISPLPQTHDLVRVWVLTFSLGKSTGLMGEYRSLLLPKEVPGVPSDIGRSPIFGIKTGVEVEYLRSGGSRYRVVCF